MATRSLAWFDLPDPAVLAGSSVQVDGWIVGAYDPGELTVALDGKPFPTHRVARHDVVTAFPDRPVAIGFRSLVTLADLGPGDARLELVAGGRTLESRAVRLQPRKAPTGKVGLFILGAARCGTTSLHALLDAHPDVCMSRPKEPLFFEAEHQEGPGYYLRRYFGHWNGERLLGEARHRNLFYPWIPPRIAAYNPRARVIVVVRHPIERLLSQWMLHPEAAGPGPGRARSLSLAKALVLNLDRLARVGCPGPAAVRAVYPRMLRWYGSDGFHALLDSGDYGPQLEVVRRCFPPGQILFLEFGELVEDPAGTAHRVLRFCGLDPARHPAPRLTRENAGNMMMPGYDCWLLGQEILRSAGMPRVHDLRHTFLLEPAMLEALRRYFRPRLARVEAAFGRPLGWHY